ncbi:MAG TPA: hypothetical protein VEU30_15440 [Thermoanaerobaculia bacterium]|nr:hypothetical protein [Thermoanaerobaculia bacterium]
MRRIATVVIGLLALLVLVAAKRHAVASPANTPQDLALRAERSFAITEKRILEHFTFERTLDTITEGSGVTSEQLFRQWWSTQAEPQCGELVNGSERLCPTTESKLATGPFLPEDFVPIGITNRFDQANATQCGQYRLIYANRNVTSREAFHIIFEAEMPNPKPELGILGCRPVAQFWADLSGVEASDARRAHLEKFFYKGIDGLPPAMHADHFHRNQAGIRALQLTLPRNFPHFYQFRLVREDGVLTVKPDVLEDTVLAKLIDPVARPDERGQRFRQWFLENLKTLTPRDANLYHIKWPKEFQIADVKPKNEQIYALNVAFYFVRQTPEGQAYAQQIADELQRLGSTLTPTQVIDRAETRNCVGCHFGPIPLPVGEGVEFPPALDLMSHISEQNDTATDYVLSPAVKAFVPHRMQILKDFLLHGKAPVHSN